MKRIISAILLCVLCLGCVFALASCGSPSKDPEKAKKALENSGYTVVMTKGEKTGNDKIDTMLSASIANSDNMITISYYNDSSAAKEAYDLAKDAVKELNKLAKKNNKETKYEAGRSGKMVWIGTETAVEAAK